MKTKLLTQVASSDIEMLKIHGDLIYLVQSGGIIFIDKSSIDKLIELLKELK